MKQRTAVDAYGRRYDYAEVPPVPPTPAADAPRLERWMKWKRAERLRITLGSQLDRATRRGSRGTTVKLDDLATLLAVIEPGEQPK